MKMHSMLFVLTIIFAQYSTARGTVSKSGNFHASIFGTFSPEGDLAFSKYIEGNTGSNTVTPGKATFSTTSFTSYGAELVFSPGEISAFSFGYVVDGQREVDYVEIDYQAGTSTRTYKFPKDLISNSAFLFNYYVTPDPTQGYLSLGLNYSNPTWTITTATNNKVDLKGGLGFQMAFGLAMVKGVLFEIGGKYTTIKMKYTDPTTNNFQDFGSGSVSNLTVGFKFML
jgi:hypothetical protein